MIDIDKKILDTQKRIDEEKNKIFKANEQIKTSKTSLSKYEKNLKELTKLKKRYDDFQMKMQDSLAEFE